MRPSRSLIQVDGDALGGIEAESAESCFQRPGQQGRVVAVGRGDHNPYGHAMAFDCQRALGSLLSPVHRGSARDLPCTGELVKNSR